MAHFRTHPFHWKWPVIEWTTKTFFLCFYYLFFWVNETFFLAFLFWKEPFTRQGEHPFDMESCQAIGAMCVLVLSKLGFLKPYFLFFTFSHSLKVYVYSNTLLTIFLTKS